MSFAKRSYHKELLDEDNIPRADLEQNLRELRVINAWLGGHQVTLAGVSALAGKRKNFSICEIGCGGGDNLAAIAHNAYKQNQQVQLFGIDIKQECIDFAQQNEQLPNNTQFIVSDYEKVHFAEKPDIIFSSLFCHHFTQQQLVAQLQWMKNNSRLGFFINDLHRHPMAYYSIKWITSLFSQSHLVKHDAPLSVKRGFTKNELLEICRLANVVPVQLQWKWAFRYLLIYHQ